MAPGFSLLLGMQQDDDWVNATETEDTRFCMIVCPTF
jgi:hypothetical protein